MSLALWACVASLAAAPRPIVALTFIGDEADRGAFTGSLSELLMRLDVDLGLRQTDAPLPKDRLLAIITADWSEPAEVTVTIHDSLERVVLLRRLSRAGSASVVIEAATHIIQSVIEELANPAVKLSSPPLATARVPLPSALPSMKSCSC